MFNFEIFYETYLVTYDLAKCNITYLATYDLATCNMHAYPIL